METPARDEELLYLQEIGILWSHGSGGLFGRVKSGWAGKPVSTVHITILDIISKIQQSANPDHMIILGVNTVSHPGDMHCLSL